MSRKYSSLIIVLLALVLKYSHCDDYSDYVDYDDCNAGDNHCLTAHNNEKKHECAENNGSFIDTLKQIHSEGINATFILNVNTANETVERVVNYLRLAHKVYTPHRTTIDKALKILSTANLTENCMKSFRASLNAYRNNQHWPQKFMDSSGKMPKGLISVVFSSLGDFDQCIDIKSPPLDQNGLVITGKYCLLEIEMPLNSNYKQEKLYSFATNFVEYYGLQHVYNPSLAPHGLEYMSDTMYRWAICVPSQCESNEIQQIINDVLTPVTRGLKVKISQKCQTKHQTYLLDNYEVFSIWMLSFLAIIVLLSTCFEIYLTYLRQWINFIRAESPDSSHANHATHRIQLMLSFSLIKNTNDLWEKSSRFSSLDTIKLFIIFNIYAIHVYAFTPLIGTITVKDYFTTVPVQFLHSNKYFLLRSPQILDALFAMSGFIFAYGMLGKLQKSKGKFSYLSYITLRWIRFALAVSGSFLFFNLLPLLGNGPVWEYGTNIFMHPCKSTTKLVYSVLQISNFFESYEIIDGGPKMGICNIPTWFMSAIFQLQIIAPFYVVLYYRKPMLATVVNIATIIVGLFLIVLPYFFGIKPYTQYAHPDTLRSLLKEFHWYHIGTNSYVSMFFVGILFGLGLRNNVRINRYMSAILWILSLAVIMSVFLWNNKLWQIDPTAMTDFDAMLWLTFGKLMSCLAFSWIFYACCSGSGGLFSRMLSWSGFRPLNKLSFSIFLTHMIIVVVRIFSIKQPISITDPQMIHNIIIDLILSTAVAYFFYILIDAPISNIVAIVTRPIAKSVKPGDERNISGDENLCAPALENNNNINNNTLNNSNYISVIRL